MVKGRRVVQFGRNTRDNNLSDLFITSMITDWIGRHEMLWPINEKYNFRVKNNNQVMKQRENLH